MTTIVQRGTWAGWPDGVAIWLADDPAVSMFTAVATYRSETGRHDADSGPIVLPVGGGRTVAQCQEMANAFDLKRTGRSGWQATYAKYNMDPASTARPSTTSPHVSGYCADIAPAAFLNWMIANGGRFGWRRTLVAANDLRHFQYFPGTATAALDVTSLDGSTVPASPSEDLMPLIDTVYAEHNATFYIVHGAGCDAVPLAQRDVWNQRVLGFIAQPWDNNNIPYLGVFKSGQPAGAPGVDQHTNDTLVASWLAGRGIPVIPTPSTPYRFPTAPAATFSDAQLKAIGAAVPVPAPAAIDYAALAKAVNDDAAKRMVS